MIASESQICVLLASTQEEPARVIVAASSDARIDCGTLLREALAAYGLRGGGSPTMAQGQIAKVHLDAPLQQHRERFEERVVLLK